MNRLHPPPRKWLSALVVVLSAATEAIPAHASPNFQSILRKAPASSPTNADELTWTLNLTEGVRCMDPTDFGVSGTTAALTLSPATECLDSYEATLSGGDLAGLNGTVTLTCRRIRTSRAVPARAWTTGRVPGSNTVEAAAAGLDPVTFTATAKATPDFDGATGPSAAAIPSSTWTAAVRWTWPTFFLFAQSFGQPAP